MYVVAMVLYIVLSIGCALAPILATLAVFRFLDGVPGGLAAIVCIGILITSVPMSKMAVAVVLLQVIVLCAPGFGPVIGGLLVLDVQWRAVFWTTVAFAVLGLVASLGLPRRPPPTAPPRFDAAGFVCLTTSVVALTLGVSKGNDWGWTSYPIVILFTVSIDAAVLFVIVERQTEHPLLNMAMFKDATFNVGMVLTAVVGIQLNTVLSFIPTFLKSVQGLSAIDAGIVMIPQALVFVTAVALANRLNRTWGIRPTMVTGLAVLGAATLMMTRITVDMPRDELATILAVCSTGLGLAFGPILSAATSRLSMNLIPDGIQFRTIVQRILGARPSRSGRSPPATDPGRPVGSAQPGGRAVALRAAATLAGLASGAVEPAEVPRPGAVVQRRVPDRRTDDHREHRARLRDALGRPAAQG